jgi:hypothetical protein
MEHEDILSCSQEPSTGSYHDPDQSIPYHHYHNSSSNHHNILLISTISRTSAAICTAVAVAQYNGRW